MGGKIIGHVLFACPGTNVLIAADFGEDLYATEHGRGLIDKGPRAIEGIRRDTVYPDVGMVGLERLQQVQGELLFGGILGIGRRFRWPLFVEDALLLENICLLIRCTELRGWRIEDKAHGQGAFWGHQDEKDEALTAQIAVTVPVAQYISRCKRL